MSIIPWALSLLVGVSLGLLGGGGSILTLPILMYGFGVEEKEAIATSLLVVGLTSAAAIVPHARDGHVSWRIGLWFAGAGSVGAFAGGALAAWIPGPWLVRGFLVMMVAAAIAMIRGSTDAPVAPAPADLRLPQILAQGVAVGGVAGLVGAGGGFLVVPALVLFGGLGMADAIGTSLLVIAIQSLSGFVGHATHVTVDLPLAAGVTAAAIVGSWIGGRWSARVPAHLLRQGFGGLVLVMALYIGARGA
jgi:hypothetical protein